MKGVILLLAASTAGCQGLAAGTAQAPAEGIRIEIRGCGNTVNIIGDANGSATAAPESKNGDMKQDQKNEVPLTIKPIP